MYYFLDSKLDANSSGIEHAEVKRLKLFKRNHVKAKITTNEFNRFGHSNLSLYGLDDDDYVNMFEFFASPKLRRKLNEGAYENAKRSSSENVWRYWQKYVIDTDK